MIEHEDGEKYGTIIGVVAPFEFGPQRQKNSSKIILGDYHHYYGGFGYARITNHQISATLKHIEAVWEKFVPNQEFSYSFADERIENLYKAERGLTKVVTTLTVISFVISTLGLFSFIALAIRQRTKEIGIRKVLGASVAGIVGMLSKDFIKLVVVAILIASPIAWYAMNRWLADFAYRIDIEWWMFGLAGMVAIVIALLTMSIQAIRAAVANPVESLRSE